MLKKHMKKIFDNFYIFSKFAFSLILLICLIGVLYVFLINYKNQDKLSKNQFIFDQEFKENIYKNSQLINKIAEEIKFNEKTLNEIKKTLTIQDENKMISNLNKNIQVLNKNFELLSKEIDNLKNNKVSSLQKNKKESQDIFDKNRSDIIDLILIKYENNIEFDQEFEYLRKLISKSNVLNYEKLSILSAKKFKGYKYIKEIFEEEVNLFLKESINQNSDSFFSKIILPYIEISPTSENTITNDLILKINEIKLQIENRKITSALKNLQTIENYEKIFKLSSLEIKKYLNFKTELNILR